MLSFRKVIARGSLRSILHLCAQIEPKNRITPYSRACFLSSNAKSTSGKAALQSYLDGWVGLPPTTTQSSSKVLQSNDNNNNSPVMRARAAMAKGSLLLSGSSYLLPTLRLQHGETPESLRSRLEQQLASVNNLQLQTTGTADGSSGGGNAPPTWCCPIVLDASALAPDGSPHYRSPPPGSIVDMVSILGQFGMQVIGISAGSRELSFQLTEEAARVGIPTLWTPRRAGSTTDPRFDVTQVLQLVQQKQQEQQLRRRRKQQQQEEEEEVDTDTTHGVTPQTGELEVTTNVDNNSDQATVQAASKLESFENQEDIPSVKGTDTNTSSTTIMNDKDDKILGNPPKDDDNYEGQLLQSSPSIPSAPIIEFSSTSTLYHGSVRSGQQIMSTKGQSLVILGSVNSGGEVLSDGDIFIFGKLRGRAFAGLGTTSSSGGSKTESRQQQQQHSDCSEQEEESTSSSARIVATSFDAELVAIGDTFTTIDKVGDLNTKISLQPGRPLMVTLVDKTTEEGEATQSLEFLPVDL